MENMENNERLQEYAEKQAASGFDADAFLKQALERTQNKVATQKKKQRIVFGIMLAEGLIALIGGVLTLVLTHNLPIGISIIILGAFIVGAVVVMNIRVMKQLNKMKDSADAYVENASKIISSTEDKKEQ